eukprot:gene7756-9542_t
MTMKIYTYNENPRVYKALIAAKYVGVNIEVPAFEFGKDNKTPEFLKKAPLGKVPVLETEKGCIFESNAIARYVARLGGKIYGADAFESATVDQWIDYAANEIDPSAAAWLYPIMGFLPFNPRDTQKAKENMKSALNTLNTHLLSRSFLTGARVTLADIVVVCSLLSFYRMVFEKSFIEAYPNTNRWFTTCINQPQFHSVIGEFKFCEKMAEAKKDEKPKKEEKPAAAAPKKEEKPKAAAPAADEEDAPKEEKKKNPLDELPASKFSLDEFKRTYSNMDTRKEALPWLWEHYDAEGFSFYKATYKHNNELEARFKTLNLIGGFYQRLERLHKYAFASMIIFDDPSVEGSKQSISGIWIFRGKAIPADMLDCDDSMVYNWDVIDHTKPENKVMIENYFAWDGDFEGKTFVDGKVYK